MAGLPIPKEAWPVNCTNMLIPMRKRPAILLILLFFCVLSLPACVTTSASLGANSIRAPYATNLRNYQTFSWYQPQPAEAANYSKNYSEDLDPKLRQAIEEELQERGFRKVETNPDLLVAYDVAVSVPANMDNPVLYQEGFGYSYAYMGGYRYDYGYADMPGYRSVDLFKEGTLVIDLINPKSNLLLWRGWAEGGITNFKANQKSVRQQVAEVLQKL